MQLIDYEQLFFTRSLAVTYRHFVPIDSVCRFDGEVLPPLPGSTDRLIRCTLSDPSKPERIFAEAEVTMAASRGPAPSTKNTFLELTTSGPVSPPSMMHIPEGDDGWWPAPAREEELRLLGEGSGLRFADMNGDFPAVRDGAKAAYARIEGQTFWDFTPDCSVSWDVGRPGAADALMTCPAKVVRRLHWRASSNVEAPRLSVHAAGLYIFTLNAMGPQGRAQGGAIATAFDDIMGLCCVRELGFLPALNTVKLSVSYREAMPLGVPVLAIARLVQVEGRSAFTEAAILRPGDASPGFADVWTSPCFARATAEWRRAKPKSVGLEKALSYDEALAAFGHGGQGSVPETSQYKDREERSRL